MQVLVLYEAVELSTTYLSFFRPIGRVFGDIGQSNFSATQWSAKVTRTSEASIVKGICLGNRTSNTGTGQGIHNPSPSEDSKLGQLLRCKTGSRVTVNAVGNAKQAHFI